MDDEGLPVMAAIDMMDTDDRSLYFMTAKDKRFYDRLKNNGFLAFTEMKGEDTISRVAVSIRREVGEFGYEKFFNYFRRIDICMKYIRQRNQDRF